MTDYPFTDPISARQCTLVILPGRPPVVRHPFCTTQADVSLHLDAFHCTSCGWNGRVSGAWAHDMMTAGRNGGDTVGDRSPGDTR